jgi:tetratricopeptide (TPR) repeat protein
MTETPEPEFDIQHLRPVILDLLHQERRQLAWQLLELYVPKARSLQHWDTLGYLSLKAEHRELYLKCAQAAYVSAETPQQAYIARCNLYKAYNVMNDPDQALFYIEQNLHVTPDDFETVCQKAFNLALKGDRETSERMLLNLQQKHPDRAEDLRSALSGRLLRQGKLSEGIHSFLGTFKPKSHRFDVQLKMQRWTGRIQPGRTIYVDGEGGVGDEIINIRFFDRIRSLGMRPILYSAWHEYRADTVHLFRRLGHEVITDTHSMDTREFWAPMMSLPALLNLTEADLWQGPYMTPLRQAKNKLQGDRPRIGIKCAGNPYFSQDEYRKIPIDVMLQYLPPEADIYYMDKSACDHPGVISLHDRIETWEDTLDFIDQMDHIVSSCTSLVHAAGALGAPTCVIVPIAEYYIWSTSSTTTRSPWYGDNLHVFKQSVVRSWHEPLAAMSEHVRKYLNL